MMNSRGFFRHLMVAGLTAALLFACDADPGAGDHPDAAALVDARELVDTGAGADALDDGARWSAVRARVDAHVLADVTLLVGDASGVLMVHEKGGSTAATEYRIASATKWVTAAAIMRLVEAGTMSLADRPQDYLDYWTDDPDDARSRVTLEQLLSFTSGFRTWPGLVACAYESTSSLAACTWTMYAYHFHYEPGTTYHYGPAHMHTAARMAEIATGKSWQEIVLDEIGTPLGIDDLSWALAGPDHPLPSGGLRTSGASYGRFLQAIASGEILAASRENMATPRTVGLSIGYTPIGGDGLGEWSYGLGQWRECGDSSWSSDCDERGVSSSPGAFGFYPWYDSANGYWGILATELSRDGDESPPDVTIPLGLELQPLIEAAYAVGS